MKIKLCILFLSLSSIVSGQTFTRLSITLGPTISGQIKTPRHYGDGGMKPGLAASIEPAILTFGAKKQFDLNIALSYIQKGGQNYSPIFTYDQFGQPAGTGSETYKVTLHYFSVSPNVKVNFSKIFFVKAGPRLDVLTGFSIHDRFSSDPRTRKDFNSITSGITYGAGICTGKGKVKFMCELVGQNDLTASSYNRASGQSFRNYCYLVNLGLTIGLKTKEE